MLCTMLSDIWKYISTGYWPSLSLTVTAPLPHPQLPADQEVETRQAPSVGTRAVRSSAHQVDEVPVHVLTELAPGDTGAGPAIIEGPFFTARVLPGWTFRVTSAGDLLLNDTL